MGDLVSLRLVGSPHFEAHYKSQMKTRHESLRPVRPAVFLKIVDETPRATARTIAGLCPRRFRERQFMVARRGRFHVSSIWYPHHDHLNNITNSIEARQNRAIGIIRHDCNRTASVSALQNALGYAEINAHRKCSRLRLFHKCFFDTGLAVSYISKTQRLSAILDHGHKVKVKCRRCDSN